MAGFHDVSLPNDFAKGAKGGPGFKTTVLTLSSGLEKRNIDWDVARAKYTVGMGLRNIGLVQHLIDFFRGRRGRAFSFRMRDWADYQIPFPTRDPQFMGTGNGIAVSYQLVKDYGDAEGPYTRIITKPVDNGTIRLAVDGVEKAETTDFTVNYTTGAITFLVPPGNGLDVFTLYAEFDVQVRFDIDDMEVAIEQVSSGSWDGITLIEVQEP